MSDMQADPQVDPLNLRWEDFITQANAAIRRIEHEIAGKRGRIYRLKEAIKTARKFIAEGHEFVLDRAARR